MRLHLTSPAVREDGDYTAYVNGANMKGGGSGFAVIQLDEYGATDLTFDEPGEIDQLIKAACEAKRLLLEARVPHPYQDADGRCAECSVHKGHHREPEPAQDDEAREDAEFAADAASLPAQAEPDERLFHADGTTRPCRSPQAHGYSALADDGIVECDVPGHHATANEGAL